MKKIVNRTPIQIVWIAIVYFVAARLGLMLAYPETNATPIWLPTGIALSAVLLLGSRIWPGIALGAFIANWQYLAGLGLSIPVSLAASFSTSAGNTLEALAGAYLIHRFTGSRNPFEQSADVLAFIMLGALISTTVSATIGTATFCLSVSEWRNFAPIWLTWWLGDAVGAIVIVPLVMTYKGFEYAVFKFRPLAGNLLFVTSIVAVSYIAFFMSYPLDFLLLPILIISAFRLGQFGSAIAICFVSGLAIYSTVNGIGPFAAKTQNEALLLQQGFIGSIAIATMVLAAIVSEKKKSELKLRESEERFRTIFNSANEAIFIHDLETGAILDVNRRMCELFGMSREEALRSDVGAISSGLPPYTLEDAVAWIRKAAAGDPQLFDWQAKDKAGRLFWVEVNMRRAAIGPVDRIIVSVRDITVRKEAKQVERDKHKLEEQIAGIVETAPGALCSFRLRPDGATSLPFVSPKWEEYYHLKQAEVQTDASPIYKRIHPDDAEHVQRTIQESAQTMLPWREEFRILNPAGGQIWVEGHSTPVREPDGSILWNGFITDITERRKAGQELEKYREHLEDLIGERTRDLENAKKALLNLLEDVNEAKNELEKANEKLKELDRLKSMFIASMSHELRTPLNSIIGFTGIILQGMAGEINDEQRDQLQRVFRSGKHLLALIEDVIDISKIEAGKIETQIEELDLVSVIDEAIATVKTDIDQKGLGVETRMPQGMLLKTDGKRLLQCLLNYLTNAVKFTEKGTISIAVREVDDGVDITVTDTGIGIKEEDMPKLFGSFVRLDSPLRVQTLGTGLGLYLTKKLTTEVLKGSVSVVSEYGKGSTFALRMPKEIG